MSDKSRTTRRVTQFSGYRIAVSLALSATIAMPPMVRAQDTAPAPVVGVSSAQSREGQRPGVKVAKGAPNIIWILLDDTGFGASSSFGGLVSTPTFDALANSGLRFTNFH